MDLSLLVIDDPMCSAGYEAHSGRVALLGAVPKGMGVIYHTGVLAGHFNGDGIAIGPNLKKDSDARDYTRRMWELRKNMAVFNMDAWNNPEFGIRRSTWEACAAVVAMRMQSDAPAETLFHKIHEAFYQEGRNTFEYAVLEQIAQSIQEGGVDFNFEQWYAYLHSSEVASKLKSNSKAGRDLAQYVEIIGPNATGKRLGFPSYLVIDSATAAEAAKSGEYSKRPRVLELLNFHNPVPGLREALGKPDK